MAPAGEYALALPPTCAGGRRWKPLSPPCGNSGRRCFTPGDAFKRALLVHLSQLPWPGNVRQLLKSDLKVMLALADEGDTLTTDALPEGVSRRACAVAARGIAGP
ncbi:hypothetical protein MJK72_22150 [Klebsiella pneumoniae]|nr:hypothetical protein MJK72_22150 [Klebsiella pneumoniae]